MSQVILFGNEKGGSGKTTTALHLIVGLLRLGFSVASIDLDLHQQSLSRYIENRMNLMQSDILPLLIPDHLSTAEMQSLLGDSSNLENRFAKILTSLSDYDFIVVDTPGGQTILSDIAHSYANKIITPVNDSFLDLDPIGQIDCKTLDVVSPGVYSQLVFSQKIKRLTRDGQHVDWVLVRNRLSSLDANNKKNIGFALNKMSKKLGFRVAPGFGDRVIFKELFLSGLTLYDVSIAKRIKITTSVVAARQEMREFMQALQIPMIEAALKRKRLELNS